jgi:hypothetical protein
MALNAEQKARLAELRESRELMELDLLHNQVHAMHSTEVQRLARAKQNQRLLNEKDKKALAQMRQCNHKKGGQGMQGLKGRGSGPNYSVIDQSFSHLPGGPVRFCTRCPASWKPGDTRKNHPLGISYEEAMTWPTNNTAGGCVEFSFGAVRAEDPQRELAPVS